MPTTEHEVLSDLFRKRPVFAAELLRDLLGVSLPAFDEARRESIDFTNIKPAPYFADAAVALVRAGPAGARPPRQRRRKPPELSASEAVLGVLVEVQRDDDPGKRYSWPVYVSTFAALLKCRVILLVLCISDKIARWATTPIGVGEPDFTLRPVVLGPSAIPKITDPEFARKHPELTVLSARVNGDGPDGHLVLRALVAALAHIEPDDARLYYLVVLDGLNLSAQNLLKKEVRTVTAIMRDDPRAGKLQQLVEGALAEGKAEGEAHGRVVALLEVLAARRIDVSEEARQRIATCTDIEQLQVWIRRSVTATTAKELFE